MLCKTDGIKQVVDKEKKYSDNKPKERVKIVDMEGNRVATVVVVNHAVTMEGTGHSNGGKEAAKNPKQGGARNRN
jgi:hypothetical protein